MDAQHEVNLLAEFAKWVHDMGLLSINDLNPPGSLFMTQIEQARERKDILSQWMAGAVIEIRHETGLGAMGLGSMWYIRVL